MERAIHLEQVSDLNNLGNGFSRLYFGPETCQRLLPTERELKKAKALCKKHNLKFSFVTPFVTDAGLKRIQSLIKLLSAEDELVINDYGVLRLAQGNKFELVAGRLLNKQYRDPRIAFLPQALCELVEHFRQSQASSDEFQRLLVSFGVNRIELDNLLQGIGTDLSNSMLSGSLYYPWVFIAATRLCLTNSCDKLYAKRRIGVFACSKECQRYRFELNNTLLKKPIYLIGNALYYKNAVLAANLERQGITRTVFQKKLLLD